MQNNNNDSNNNNNKSSDNNYNKRINNNYKNDNRLISMFMERVTCLSSFLWHSEKKTFLGSTASVHNESTLSVCICEAAFMIGTGV